MTDKIIVMTNTGSQAEARKIASALVERKLAACVNIIPGVESTYWWKGKIETAPEWTLLVKTVRANFDTVRNAIRELHSYELPECIMLEVAEGGKAYLDWIAKNTD